MRLFSMFLARSPISWNAGDTCIPDCIQKSSGTNECLGQRVFSEWMNHCFCHRKYVIHCSPHLPCRQLACGLRGLGVRAHELGQKVHAVDVAVGQLVDRALQLVVAPVPRWRRVQCRGEHVAHTRAGKWRVGNCSPPSSRLQIGAGNYSPSISPHSK